MIRRCIRTAVLAAALCLSGAVSAHAATYKVWSCANGLGQPLTTGDWSYEAIGPGTYVSSTCNTTSINGADAQSMRAVTGAGPGYVASEAAWALHAKPGTTISGLDVWWAWNAAAQWPGRIILYAGGTPHVWCQPAFQPCASVFGNGALPFGAANRTSVPAPGKTISERTAAFVAECPSSCATSNGGRAIAAYFDVYRVAVTVSDVAAPTGTTAGLVDGMLHAPIAITANATDIGGGVRDVQLLVDGNAVDTKTVGGQCQDIDPSTGDSKDFAVMRPCAPAFSAAFVLSPNGLTAGPHDVQVVAHDAAGNTGVLTRSTMTVAPALLDGSAPAGRYDAARDLFFNPDSRTDAPASTNGSGDAAAQLALVHVRSTRVKGKTVKRLSMKRTVPYAAGARVRGQLYTAAGAPIAGARVWPAIALVDGRTWRLQGGPLVTSKTGRISYLMPAGLPSRLLRIVYFPRTDSNHSLRSPAVTLNVRVPVTLRLSRHNTRSARPLTVSARILPGLGKVTGVLQILNPNGPARGWRLYRTLHFDARGRAAIRVKIHTPGRFVMRARVARQSGLPYESGTSQQAIVRVR